MTIAEITLPSGNIVQIFYSWTFGEIAIVGMLLVLNVQIAARWVYDLILTVWNQQRTIVVREDDDI